jgi:hypothetical protein
VEAAKRRAISFRWGGEFKHPEGGDPIHFYVDPYQPDDKQHTKLHAGVLKVQAEWAAQQFGTRALTPAARETPLTATPGSERPNDGTPSGQTSNPLQNFFNSLQQIFR